jgi:hypothetical protein
MKQTCLINAKENEKGIAGQATSFRAKPRNRNDRSFHMKQYLIIIIFLFFEILTLFGQENSQKVTVMSFPTNSVETIGQYVIEGYAETVNVSCIVEEFENKESTNQLIDSVCICSFDILPNNKTKFTVNLKEMSNDIFFTFDKQNRPGIGRIFSPQENETLKYKKFSETNSSLNIKIPILLIYNNPIINKELCAMLNNKEQQLNASITLKERKTIYSQLSHYYIISYIIKNSR